jgi:hypothetical protein
MLMELGTQSSQPLNILCVLLCTPRYFMGSYNKYILAFAKRTIQLRSNIFKMRSGFIVIFAIDIENWGFAIR